MKNGKSCFEWLSTTNEKEVINHKSRRNCQELTGRLMLGEHLAVGHARTLILGHLKQDSTKLQESVKAAVQRLPGKRSKRRFPMVPLDRKSVV